MKRLCNGSGFSRSLRGVQRPGLYTRSTPFFFQAEDGIRDADVTGVQTCALPICRRLMEDGSVEAIQVHRIMQAASANAILSDPGLAGVDLMRRGDVDPTKHTIIGVEGDGIRRGLTDFDRSQGGLLTRANDYLYADLVDRSGQVQGSTSPARASNELEEAIKKIAGNTWVYVVPAGHPEARKLSVLKVDLAKRVGAVVRSEEHTSELQSRPHLVCRLLLEKKKHSLTLI